MSEVLNPAAEFAYHLRVRELFADLQHVGALPVSASTLDGSVRSAGAGSREQGASVQLYIEIRDARIHTVRYQAYGCPHFLAACESLAQWLEGRAISELSEWCWRDVEVELAVPANKRSRLLLLDETVSTLFKSVKRSD